MWYYRYITISTCIIHCVSVQGAEPKYWLNLKWCGEHFRRQKWQTLFFVFLRKYFKKHGMYSFVWWYLIIYYLKWFFRCLKYPPHNICQSLSSAPWKFTQWSIPFEICLLYHMESCEKYDIWLEILIFKWMGWLVDIWK